MTVLGRFGEIISTAATGAFSAVIERLRTVFEGDSETRRQVAFSIAMIGLSAKMAKADGVVTPDEVEAFRDIFAIPEKEAQNVSRLYNLAKQDVAGFDSYARQVRGLFPGETQILVDVMDGLFHIAKADGLMHEKEQEFLDIVAAIFGITGRDYARIKARHLDSGEGDPYLILDLDRSMDDEALKAGYRQLVKENHPDMLIARGVPAEFVTIANDRLAAINKAWEQVRLERGL
ncbi:MAG: molecular chaperone DjiA [Nitratireductor sp.]|nr:molecular chaperone DjiA [Nitratireductor sp.]